MAPAMNVRMWQSPPVRRNLETLKRDGVLFVGPNDGEMACGEFGPGRMAEPLEIVAAIEEALGARRRRCTGFKALVTAGPTQEPLDPVRFLANRSSGKQGYAIADALARAGADTVLVSGPVEIAAARRACKLLKVTTAREMLAACEAALPADIAVMTRGGRRLAARHRRQQQDQESDDGSVARAQAGRKSRHPGHASRTAPNAPAPGDRLCRRDRRGDRARHRQARAARARLDRRQ